jgi:2-oxoglutarate ferredoxin oxidoreductase subunit beta
MQVNRQVYVDEKIAAAKKDGFLSYRSGELPTWCPGCGYFGILHALVKTCNQLGLKKEEICVVSGIGCSGRFPFFMEAYGFHTLHGRSVPVAGGVKLARKELTVFAVGGDGDIMGIGGGHLPHIARKNIDLTLLLFDNSIYGLTKGQSSPTTPVEQATGSHPYGNPDAPLRPVSMALSYGASFVARAFVGDVPTMEKIFTAAINHKGLSFVHLVSPCVTFDKTNITWDRMRNHFTPISETHATGNRAEAVRLAEDPIPYQGLFYQDKKRPTYHDLQDRIREKMKT